MPMYQIHIKQQFNHPISEVFADLSDHQTFGQIIGKKIKRIVDSGSDNVNGIGSIRKVSAFPAPSFEETVTNFIQDEAIEYTISKGSPIKEHHGCLYFYEQNNSVFLDYKIRFTPKPNIPGWGWLLCRLIRMPISKGLATYAAKHS